MKILFDECVPWPLRKALVGHQFESVQRCHWTGFKNGQLLLLAGAEFEVFLTSDQNLRYQQNLAGRRIAIVELSTNDLRTLLASTARIQAAIDSATAGGYLQVVCT